jgi:hypothetical protein
MSTTQENKESNTLSTSRKHGEDNKYILEDKEGTYVKVIEFPSPEGPGFGGESMWVLKTNGTVNDGYGILMNTPILTNDASCGDIIQYGGGTNQWKPKYLKNRTSEYQENVKDVLGKYPVTKPNSVDVWTCCNCGAKGVND